MLAYLTCQTPSRFVRTAWLSLQPKGDISFGLIDKTYISPRFKGRQFVWNAYNRVTAEYEIESDPSALEPVRNPHFTFHPAVMFHLKSEKDKACKDEALWQGICDVALVLQQQEEMSWIRAITSRISTLKSAGIGWSKVPTNDLAFVLYSEDVSMHIEIDFIRRQNIPTRNPPSTWYFSFDEMAIRVTASTSEPRIATLRWFHSY
jgi:hypothetical protein